MRSSACVYSQPINISVLLRQLTRCRIQGDHFEHVMSLSKVRFLTSATRFIFRGRIHRRQVGSRPKNNDDIDLITSSGLYLSMVLRLLVGEDRLPSLGVINFVTPRPNNIRVFSRVLRPNGASNGFLRTFVLMVLRRLSHVNFPALTTCKFRAFLRLIPVPL